MIRTSEEGMRLVYNSILGKGRRERMYPRVGQKVIVNFRWHGKEKTVSGILQSVARVRSGAVLGFIKMANGRVVGVPWSSAYSQFTIIK